MDLTLIAANSRRAGADGDVRAPIERVIVSARMLLPLALAQGVGRALSVRPLRDVRFIEETAALDRLLQAFGDLAHGSR